MVFLLDLTGLVMCTCGVKFSFLQHEMAWTNPHRGSSLMKSLDETDIRFIYCVVGLAKVLSMLNEYKP